MSSSITLSAATRQNLLSLQDTANLLSTTQSRLSTGKKVNSALDNPTNFFTSQALTARSGDLSALLDGISNGIQTIQSANQGITSITKLLDTAKSTASQALADKTGGGGGVKGGVTSQAAKAGGTQALASVAGATTANGVTTFDLSSPTKDASLDISLDGGATKTTIRLDSTTFASQGIDTTKVTADQLVSNINAQIANSPALAGKVKAAVGDDGRLAFTTTATGASAKVSVAGSGNATQDIGFGVAKTPPKAATATAAGVLPPTTDFSGGASASLTVTDGGKTVTVTLDKDSLLADGVTKLAPDVTSNGTTTNTANQAKVVEAINRQLAEKGSTATVELGTGTDLNKLVFKSSDVGPDAQISVSGGADTTAGGIGFTTFTVGGGRSTAPTDLPASASTPGTGAGSPITANGSAGAVTFGKSLGAAGAAVSIATGLSTTFSVNGKSITIDSTTPKAAPVGNAPAATLGTAPTREDIAAAINLQLNPAGQPAGTVTAGFDATTNALTFTDSNRANAAPTVVTSGGTNTDKIGLFSTPTTIGYAANMPSTFDFSGGNAASFKIGGKTVSLNATSPLTNGTLPNGANATRDQVVDAINTSLRSQNSNITANVISGKLTFVEGDTTTNTPLTISDASDSTGASFFDKISTSDLASESGTIAAPTSTPSVKTSTTAANNAATLSAASFGTGGQTTFTVGLTKVTLNADSPDGAGGKLGASPDSTKLLGAINKQLTDGNAGVQASMPNGKLVFSNTTASTTPPTVTTSGAGLTDQLGLFGTPAKTTLTTDLSTKLTSGKLDLSSSAAAFTIGGTSVTLSKDATDGLGGAGKLGASPTLAAVVTSLNDQLKTTGYSAFIDNNNKLTLVGPNSGTTPPALTNVSDSLGLGFGTAATATAPAAAQTIAMGFPDAGKVDLSAGKSSSFKIGDGTTTASVTINANSLLKDGTTKLGTAATTDQIREAIQFQLDTNAGGAVRATVSFDNTGALKASSNAIGGSATVSLVGVSDTAKLGLGSTTPANGTFTAGTGTPADAVVSSGTDATDGSSVALVKANTAVPAGVALGVNANASFELTLGSGSTTTLNIIGSSKTATAAGLVSEIQKAIDNDTGLNGKVKVSLGSDNKLAFSTVASGADQKLTIKAAGTADIGLGLNTAGALKGSGTDKGGSLGASSVRTTLASQFNNLLSQITQQAKDSSYNGVNLLFRNGSNASENTLHVSFNEKNTSALDIQGVKFDAEGLGLTAATGNFQTDEEINAVIEKLTAATTTLRTQSSTFGANLSVVQNRQDFTKNLSNILDTGAANLTNADLNEEAANSQALSTRNSLAISALSLANQSQQGILQLLR